MRPRRIPGRCALPRTCADEPQVLFADPVGSRAYGAIGSLRLGSAATALLRGAACPVMVVPRVATGPRDGRSAA